MFHFSPHESSLWFSPSLNLIPEEGSPPPPPPCSPWIRLLTWHPKGWRVYTPPSTNNVGRNAMAWARIVCTCFFRTVTCLFNFLTASWDATVWLDFFHFPPSYFDHFWDFIYCYCCILQRHPWLECQVFHCHISRTFLEFYAVGAVYCIDVRTARCVVRRGEILKYRQRWNIKFDW